MVNLYGKRILRVRVFVSQNKKRFNNCSRSKIALDVIVVFLQHLRCFYFLLFLSFFFLTIDSSEKKKIVGNF